MHKVLITTVPFADKDFRPIEILKANNINYVLNPLGRKLRGGELLDLISDFDAIIAGTEVITSAVMKKAKNLKLISRVGIGLDGVDLSAAKKYGVSVSYTPDAPAPAVAELTIGLILNLLRGIHLANYEMRKGLWNRHFGRRISEVKFGIIGCGRIGGGVVKLLTSLGAKHIMINDINPYIQKIDSAEYCSKEHIYQYADVISLHLPLNIETKNLITSTQIAMMKSDSIIINTSRGGIVNEDDLFRALQENIIYGAAVDVFESEPYYGPLTLQNNCILTSHMGSMSFDCRAAMEFEATMEVVRFLSGNPLKNPVPSAEYQLREN